MRRLLVRCGVSLLIELDIAEVEDHIDRDLHEVQHVENPAQIEDRAVLAQREALDELHRDARNVAEPDEELELQALADLTDL